MFNPFDLYGPEFLLFFIVTAVVLNAAFFAWVRFSEPAAATDSRAYALMRDPYMIAYLRGGATELIKVAIFGMTERGLLQPLNSLVKSDSKGSSSNNHPIEKQIAAQCQSSRHIHDLASEPLLKLNADRYAEPLKECGLIAGTQEYNRRLPVMILVAGSLLLLAAIKIGVAFSRGRHNVMFLVMLLVFSLFVCWRTFRTQRTKLGTHALEMQQSLFHRLLSRIKQMKSSGATNEAILVAATFGFSKLPKSRFPLAYLLRRDPRQNSSSSSCSSSCSSSSCGGGCGGGCGGCGS